jgi:hypothetical protein
MCAGAALVQAVRAALAGRSARHAALNARSTKCVCGPREKLCARRPTPPPTKPAAHVGRRCEAAGITLLLLPPHARVGMCSAAAHTLCRPPSWYNSLKLCRALCIVGRAHPPAESRLATSCSKGGHISSDAAHQQLLLSCRLRLHQSTSAAAGSTAGCSTESAREGKLARRSRSSTPFMTPRAPTARW